MGYVLSWVAFGFGVGVGWFGFGWVGGWWVHGSRVCEWVGYMGHYLQGI